LDVQQHPLTGVGFGAYWNLDEVIRIQYALQAVLGFPHTIVVAHNGYIEELLATGAVGLALLLIFWIYVMYAAIKRARQGDNLGWLTFSFVLLYLMANITQSIMQWYHELLPFMVPLALVALMESTRSASGKVDSSIPKEGNHPRKLLLS
jgi:O-antigen ligase